VNKTVLSGGFYPYIVGLHYQIRNHKYSLPADSGWVSVSPQVDAVMVTLGDIAHASFSVNSFLPKIYSFWFFFF
jgi:hypothetical protein